MINGSSTPKPIINGLSPEEWRRTWLSSQGIDPNAGTIRDKQQAVMDVLASILLKQLAPSEHSPSDKWVKDLIDGVLEGYNLDAHRFEAYLANPELIRLIR